MTDSPMDHGANALETKGFLKSLYDFKFESFVAMRLLRVLYIIITIVYSLAALIFFIASLASGKALSIVVAIIVIPLGYLIYLAFARVTIEVMMVIFRIGADVRSIANRGSGAGESPSS